MSFRGALVKNTSGLTAANFNVGTGADTDGAYITWANNIYDTNSFHSVADTSKLVIPANVPASQYCILTACVSLSSVTANGSLQLGIFKNGANTYNEFGGRTMLTLTSGGPLDYIQVRTAPLLMTPGDFFQAKLWSSDNSITVASTSSFGIRVLDSNTQTQRVLTRKAADQTAANYSTPTPIAWDQNVYDTDSIHSTSVQNTKLIIPSALNGKYGVITASVECGAVTAATEAYAIITKGGVEFDGFGGNAAVTNIGLHAFVVNSQPVLLATNDAYETVLYSQDTSITVTATLSSFGLIVVG